MTRQIRVYTASKLDYAERWKKLRVEWKEVHFTARWPFFVGQIPDDGYHAKQFWQDDHEDVKRADVVLVYAEKSEEKLRGALVEAGMGIAGGKKVIVVGDHPDYSTWQFHPLVTRCRSLEQARVHLKTWSKELYNDF